FHVSRFTFDSMARRRALDLLQPAAIHLQPLVLQPLLHPVGGPTLSAGGGGKPPAPAGPRPVEPLSRRRMGAICDGGAAPARGAAVSGSRMEWGQQQA